MQTIYALANSIAESSPAIRKSVGAIHALLARRVIDQANTVQIDPDDMSGTLTRLIAAAAAGSNTALAALVTATDLTGPGVLTTLTANVDAHATQGGALAAKILSTMAPGDIVTAITGNPAALAALTMALAA